MCSGSKDTVVNKKDTVLALKMKMTMLIGMTMEVVMEVIMLVIIFNFYSEFTLRPCSFIISLYLCNKPVRQGLLLAPSYRYGNWGTEVLKNIPMLLI